LAADEHEEEEESATHRSLVTSFELTRV